MEAFAMGGYGVYVWSSFGLTFIVLVISAAQARRRHRLTLRDIKQRIEALDYAS